MPRGKPLSLGDTSAPEHRVLRLVNLHHDVQDADILSFFDGFEVVDWKRAKNIKSGKKNVVYIIMPSIQELMRAERELDETEIHGRPVRLTRANSGFTLKREGLLNEQDNDAKAHVKTEQAMEPEQVTMARLGNKSKGEDVFQEEGEITSPLEPATELVKWDTEDSDSTVISTSEEITTSMAQNNTPRRRRRGTHSRGQHSHGQQSMDAHATRILLINNVHPEANISSIRLFFNGYNVVDFQVRRNTKTNKFMGFGFVMLGSADERARALRELHGKSLMGRIVQLEGVSKAVPLNDDGSGFADPAIFNSPFESPSGQAKRAHGRDSSTAQKETPQAKKEIPQLDGTGSPKKNTTSVQRTVMNHAARLASSTYKAPSAFTLDGQAGSSTYTAPSNTTFDSYPESSAYGVSAALPYANQLGSSAFIMPTAATLDEQARSSVFTMPTAMALDTQDGSPAYVAPSAVTLDNQAGLPGYIMPSAMAFDNQIGSSEYVASTAANYAGQAGASAYVAPTAVTLDNQADSSANIMPNATNLEIQAGSSTYGDAAQGQAQASEASKIAATEPATIPFPPLEVPGLSSVAPNSWVGPVYDANAILPTWDVELAHMTLKRWNLAGNSSTDRKFNMVTEEDWYYFQPRQVAKYM